MAPPYGGLLLSESWANVVVGSAQAWRSQIYGGIAIAVDAEAAQTLRQGGRVTDVVTFFAPFDPFEGPDAEAAPVVQKIVRRLEEQMAGSIYRSNDVGIFYSDDVSPVGVWLAARLLCKIWGIGGEDALRYLRGDAEMRHLLDQNLSDFVPLHFSLPSDVLEGTWFEHDVLAIPRHYDNLIDTWVPWVRHGMLSPSAWASTVRSIEDDQVDDATTVDLIAKVTELGESALRRALRLLYMQHPKIEQETFFEWLPESLEGNTTIDVFSNPAMMFWFADGFSEDQERLIFRYAAEVIGNAYWTDTSRPKAPPLARVREAVVVWTKRVGVEHPPLQLIRTEGIQGFQVYISQVLGAVGMMLNEGGWMWKLRTLLEIERDVRARMKSPPPPPVLLQGLRSLMSVEDAAPPTMSGRRTR